MDNLFAMGFNWCHFVSGFLLIPVLSFASAGENTDIQLLADIKAIVSDMADMQSAQKIELREMIMGRYNRGVLPALELLDDYLYSLLIQSADQLDTNNWYLSRIENAVLNSTQKVEVVSSSLDPLLVSVSNINDSVVSILNAITNNAPLAYSPAFLTNWYATTSTALILGTYNANVLRNYYRNLFGYTPSSAELATFTQTFYYAGAQHEYYADFLSLISSRSLPFGNDASGSSYSSRYDYLRSAYDTLLSNIGFNTGGRNLQIKSMQAVADMRYFQYGTRELTDLVASMTNHNILVDSPFVDVQTETGTDHGFSHAFKDTVGDLASSIVPTVEDNLPEVNTNDITEIEDGSFSTLWHRESSASSDNNALTGLAIGIDSILHSSSSSISGVFDVGSGSDYVITVPNSLGGSDFVYKIPSMAPKYRPYVLFFVGLLKCCMVIYFALLVWEDVFKDVWMGRRF